MSPWVVDASVAAKWCLPPRDEPLVGEALELLGRYAKGELRLVVPDLFWAELGNIVWKAARRGRLTTSAAASAIEALRNCKLPTVPSETLLPQAFAIAAAFDRTVYDSIYVALAIDAKGQLITADQRLANALAAHLPVKWLGAV